MTQGYVESQTYFSQILKTDCSDVDFIEMSVLMKYVDNLLFCSENKWASIVDRIYLLQQLALKDYKVY